MKPTTLLTPLLTANLALGAKWTQKRRESREARRALSSSSSGPNKHVDGPVVDSKQEGVITNNTFLAYSENWAGAVLVSSGFTSVTGTIVVPTPTAAMDGVESAGAAWVGIDGDTCTTAILQTGIDWYIQDGGALAFDAWYEWYPDYAYTFPASTLSLAPGNSIRLTVTATSPTAGSATIENLSTGERVSQTFADVADGALCGTNVEWIVEDFEGCDDAGECGLVPFADFGEVVFKGCGAGQMGRGTVTPGMEGEGLVVFDLYQGGKVLTDCEVNNGTVACRYL